jgi:type VI secretion system protein ImpF
VAELTTRERLQPSLLDRLTDDDPANRHESRELRVMSLQQIREAVQRDLAWLLNCGCLATTEDLEDFPHVMHSVLNYGIPDLSGMTVHNWDAVTLERALTQAIADFEPRILENSLHVRVVTDAEDMHRNAMTFEIEGKLWSQPMPVRLLWNTTVDLETGDIKVKEQGR